MNDAAPFTLRRIEARDDAIVAAIIRATMTEFGCAGEGFAIHDAEVGAMSAHYASPDSAYWVVEVDGRVLGCGGFARLAGTSRDDATAELRKMYFRDELRGRGAGKRLLAVSLESMRAAGYRTAYLETTTQMHAARALYQHFGFEEVCAPAGATGHHGCDRYMRLSLVDARGTPPSRRA
ncbi:MAG: GNAT family N-acetyltransferase [Planctomycetes bacterium]|nr:GNAT family N-acetyltransferase [Planctomycetota bacterium]